MKKNFFVTFFLPGHAWPFPCLYRAHIVFYMYKRLAEKSKYIQNKSTVISLWWKHHSERVSTNVNLQRPRDEQKTHFFTYWRPSICEISKLEVFQKKRNLSPVTLYNDVTSCQKSEETNDAFSSKCWITLLLGPFWRQKTHLAHFVKNGSFREKSENVVI